MTITLRKLSVASVLCLWPAAAFAQGSPISPQQALAAQGQDVIVEGTAAISEAVGMPGTFVRLTDNSDATMIGYIPQGDESRFPDLKELDGKRVEMTGVVEQSNGHSMIELSSASQLRIVQ
jgi:hypothetical protein